MLDLSVKNQSDFLPEEISSGVHKNYRNKKWFEMEVFAITDLCIPSESVLETCNKKFEVIYITHHAGNARKITMFV